MRSEELPTLIRQLCLVAFLLFASILVQAQSEDEDAPQAPQTVESEVVSPASDDSLPGQSAEDPVELDPQRVTGTRLQGGDPSAQVYSYTSEDIARRGVSTIEEFFRKMPWTFSSMNTQTYNEGGGNEVNRGTGPDFDAQLFGLGLGVSTVNLRGMGSPNTLVLLNGRRIAGTGGQEADFANLLNIPIAAIDRVDIQLGGASAVYGSDAIGGVVNFITKKDYRGISASHRQELSSTDADSLRSSVTGGYSWDRGNATMVLSRSSSNPVNTYKTGFHSRDQRDIFGPESAFDGRNNRTGQPGVVCEMVKLPPPVWDPSRPPQYRCAGGFTGPFFQLPPGHSAENASVDDFETFEIRFPEGSPWPIDIIPPENGASTENTSLLLSVEHHVTDNLRVYGDINWSVSDSFRLTSADTVNQFIVPASNAWNPFGKHVLIYYAPVYETENGLMPAPFQTAENKNRTLNVGFIWGFDAFGESHELQVDISRSKSWRETTGFEFTTSRSRFDPGAERFYEALSSSDPNVALNFFGDGTAQGANFSEFLGQTDGPFLGENETREFEITLRGKLLDLWAGPTTFSLGWEYRETSSLARGGIPDSNFELVSDPGKPFNFYAGGSLINSGLSRPTRDTQSVFTEIAVPLVATDNNLAGVHSLFFTVQARWDTNEAEGTLGGLERPSVAIRNWYWDPDEGFLYAESTWPLSLVNPNLTTSEISRASPRFGFQYNPSPDFTARLSWQRNYRSPTWRNQYGAREPTSYNLSCGGFGRGVCIDPFDPDGPTEITRASGVNQNILDYSPNVREESADNTSLSFDWTISSVPGLSWQLQWERSDFTDKIEASSGYLYDADTFHLVIANPQIGVRNERGDLVGVNIREFNIAEALNEMVSTQVEYSFSSSYGSFTPRIRYTRYLDDFSRLAPDQAPISVLGQREGNDEYRITGSLTWIRDRISADVFMYYAPGHPYDGPFCQTRDLELPNTKCTESFVPIPLETASTTTVDLTVTYTMDMGVTIRAGGQNIFDRKAPYSFFWGQAPYDPGRWDARGQVLFVDVTWDFDLGR
ncbi:hypothetical protein C6500_00460 [Candidatus Poribacteria bacterium]|nr:MAG: hypothetical protein C6500_00460 [Candidatus Poribacteria bacterium]